jgi:t-SNARE complex subunit (syntaxin)
MDNGQWTRAGLLLLRIHLGTEQHITAHHSMSFADAGRKRKDRDGTAGKGIGSSSLDIDLEAGRQSKSTQVQEASAILQGISQKLSQFTSCIGSITRFENSLGTRSDTQQARDNVKATIARCQQLHVEILNGLRDLDDINSKSKVKDPTMKKIMLPKDHLREQVEELYANYTAIVRSYEEKLNSATVRDEFALQQQLQLQQQKAQQQQSDKTPLLLNEQNTGQYTEEGGFQQQQQQQQQQLSQVQLQEQQLISDASLQYHSDLVQQRDKAITSISQGVQDINKIFKDLDEMVGQQGEQIDSIENNMMNYATNNQLASHELVKADNYQKKKGKWTCILLVALVIFLVIFLALII